MSFYVEHSVPRLVRSMMELGHCSITAVALPANHWHSTAQVSQHCGCCPIFPHLSHFSWLHWWGFAQGLSKRVRCNVESLGFPQSTSYAHLSAGWNFHGAVVCLVYSHALAGFWLVSRFCPLIYAQQHFEKPISTTSLKTFINWHAGHLYHFEIAWPILSLLSTTDSSTLAMSFSYNYALDTTTREYILLRQLQCYSQVLCYLRQDSLHSRVSFY